MAFKMKSFSGFGNGTGSSFKKETNYLDDKTNPSNKTKSGPKGKIGSELRKKEYDARGWKYDDTIAGYNRDGTKKKEVTKDKKDTKKKDSQWGAGDVAMAGHSLYEVGKYAKKKILNKVSKGAVKKSARNLFRKAATRIGSRLVSNPIVGGLVGAGGLGYLGYKVAEKEIKDPGSNYKEQKKNIKKTARTNYTHGGHSVMGHGK